MSDPLLDRFITEFADHLVPEAFAAPTCAYRVSLEPIDLTAVGGTPDVGARFDAWVDERLVDALEATWPDDVPLAIAFTSDGHLLRRYDDCGCGALTCVTGQVRAEVADLDTPWVLGAWLPRPAARWQAVTDDDGDEVDQVLVAPDDVRWQASWYAEGRGRGPAVSRAGILDLHGEAIVAARRVRPPATPATRELHRMLYRHRARRRHPLRGHTR